MEDAARYIQRKWKWFQDVGKFLAKKKKKGRKGGKKKKKWCLLLTLSLINLNNGRRACESRRPLDYTAHQER